VTATLLLVPRALTARKLRTALTALGIVLGVALVYGTLAIGRTAIDGIKRSFASAYGKTDLVVAPLGNGTVPEATAREVARVPGVAVATPRLSLFAFVLARGERKQVLLFGTDPRTAAASANEELVTGRRPVSGEEVDVEQRFADAYGMRVGSQVTLAGRGGTRRLRVVGLVRAAGGAQPPFYFFYAPLRTVQRDLDERGLITEVNVVAGDPAQTTALQARLRGALGPGFAVKTPEGKSKEVTDQFQSFTLFISIFGAISLFVGAFLIFNAFSMTVLQRTRELGMLRALGARRRSVLGFILAEAAVLGVTGSLAGLALGLGLARGLAWLMGVTLGFPIGSVVVPASAVATALGAGILTALVAALQPAIRASRVSPVAALRELAGRRRGLLSRFGWVLGALLIAGGVPGVLKAIRSDASGALAFALLPPLLLGVALVTPVLVRPLARLLSAPLQAVFGVEGRLAGDNIQRNRGRTSITSSGLMISFALLVMFSAIAVSWLSGLRANVLRGVRSDFVVEPRDLFQGAPTGFSPVLADRVRGLPGAGVVSAVRMIQQPDLGNFVALWGVDPPTYSRVVQPKVVEGRADPFAAIAPDEAAISAQLAQQKGWRPGKVLRLRGPRGPLDLTVVATVQDAWGTIVYAPASSLAAAYGPGDDAFLYAKAETKADRPQLRAGIQRLLGRYPQLEVVSNAEFLDKVDALVSRQMVFFYALVALAVVISAFGVVNTMAMSVFERQREIGVLRAVGARRWQIRRIVTDESLLIAGIAVCLGIVAGLGLGVVLVRAGLAGGAKVPFVIPWKMLAATAALGITIGIAAAILPARRAARLDVVKAISYE
jgi:putative ABC transport system permease protein